MIGFEFLNSPFVQGLIFSHLTQLILDLATVGLCLFCKLYVCMEHLSVLHAVSQHQETQACIRILANNVCKCVLIIFTFTWTLAMDDQEEERKTSLDGRIW